MMNIKKKIKINFQAGWLLLLITLCISGCGKEEENGYKENFNSYKGSLESSIYLSEIKNNCTFKDVTVELRDFSIRISATLAGTLSPSQYNLKIKFVFTDIKYLNAEMKNFLCSGYAQVYINNMQTPYEMKFEKYMGTIDASNNLSIYPQFTIEKGTTIDSMNFSFYGERIE